MKSTWSRDIQGPAGTLAGCPPVISVQTSKGRATGGVELPDALIPDALRLGRVPNEAKYELENYFQYIIRKYAL